MAFNKLRLVDNKLVLSGNKLAMCPEETDRCALSFNYILNCLTCELEYVDATSACGSVTEGWSYVFDGYCFRAHYTVDIGACSDGTECATMAEAYLVDHSPPTPPTRADLVAAGQTNANCSLHIVGTAEFQYRFDGSNAGTVVGEKSITCADAASYAQLNLYGTFTPIEMYYRHSDASGYYTRTCLNGPQVIPGDGAWHDFDCQIIFGGVLVPMRGRLTFTITPACDPEEGI
jgi:hypothetical protein